MRTHTRAPWLLLGLLGLLLPAEASASLAREPIRRVIRRSLPEIRECMGNHRYEEGTYVMHFEIRGDGHVENASIASGPAEPTPAASRCLVRVFTRLRFAPLYSSARRSRPPSSHGRTSRVPPDPRSRRRSRVVVSYPLRLVTSAAARSGGPDAGRRAPAE